MKAVADAYALFLQKIVAPARHPLVDGVGHHCDDELQRQKTMSGGWQDAQSPRQDPDCAFGSDPARIAMR